MPAFAGHGQFVLRRHGSEQVHVTRRLPGRADLVQGAPQRPDRNVGGIILDADFPSADFQRAPDQLVADENLLVSVPDEADGKMENVIIPLVKHLLALGGFLVAVPQIRKQVVEIGNMLVHAQQIETEDVNASVEAFPPDPDVLVRDGVAEKGDEFVDVVLSHDSCEIGQVAVFGFRVHGRSGRAEGLSKFGMQDEGHHQKRSGLADCDQVSRVTGQFSDVLKDLPVLFDLVFEILVMPLAVDKKRDVFGAFLLHHRHSGQAVVPHVDCGLFGNIGVMPRARGENDRVVLDAVRSSGGDVDQLEARQIEQHLSGCIPDRPVLTGLLLGEEPDEFEFALPLLVKTVEMRGDSFLCVCQQSV